MIEPGREANDSDKSFSILRMLCNEMDDGFNQLKWILSIGVRGAKYIDTSENLELNTVYLSTVLRFRLINLFVSFMDELSKAKASLGDDQANFSKVIGPYFAELSDWQLRECRNQLVSHGYRTKKHDYVFSDGVHKQWRVAYSIEEFRLLLMCCVEILNEFKRNRDVRFVELERDPFADRNVLGKKDVDERIVEMRSRSEELREST